MPPQALAREERLFTDFLARQTRSREEPETHELEEVLAALWKALRWELRRRGMWHRPPAYLGVVGLASWAEAEREARERAPEPGRGLELVADCFRYVFVDRWPYLVRRLESGGDVEGLVYRNVRNFLHDRQRQGDPLGFRVFSLLRAAARAQVETGRLRVLAGDAGIRGSTVLGAAASGRQPPAGREMLQETARVWADRLLPELVTARGKGQEVVVETLGARLADLPRERRESFRFGDLAASLVAAVRARWGAVFDLAQGPTATQGEGPREDSDELPELVRWIGPDTRFEDREDFRRLADCIRRGVESWEGTPEAHRHLEALWRWLAAHAAEPDPAPGELPSRRRLAAELGIPRNRLPELFAVLGEITEACRARLGADLPGGGAAAMSAAAAGGPDGERAAILASLGRELAAARDRWEVGEDLPEDLPEELPEDLPPGRGTLAPVRRRRRLPAAGVTAALAASLLLALGLGYLAGRSLGPFGSPGLGEGVAVNPPLVTFRAGEAVRAPEQTVTLAPGDSLLLLLFAAGEPGATFRLEISRRLETTRVDPSQPETGEVIWSVSAPATALGELSVGVPASRLAAGDYRLRLFQEGGESGEPAELVGDFGLTIERPR